MWGEHKPGVKRTKINFENEDFEVILISSILGMEVFGGYPPSP